MLVISLKDLKEAAELAADEYTINWDAWTSHTTQETEAELEAEKAALEATEERYLQLERQYHKAIDDAVPIVLDLMSRYTLEALLRRVKQIEDATK